MRAANEVAEAFRAMHGPDAPMLVCPAAWDAASARVFQDAGARAIVTSSLGVANTLGYADGEAFLPMEETLRMVRRVVAVVSVPVSVDLEGGYGDPVAAVQAAIDAGVAGVNLEDRVGEETTSLPLEEAAARVAAIREAAGDFPLFINARTDTAHLGGDLDDAVARANAYLEAGADCTLPILPAELKTVDVIRELVGRINGPVNVAINSGRPNVHDLEGTGVRRISIAVSKSMHGYIQRIARHLLSEGTFAPMDAELPFPAVNDTFRQIATKISPSSIRTS